LLLQFATKVGRAINIEIVERFITSGQPEFVAVGGHLLKALELDVAEEAISGYLQMFAGMLSADKHHVCLLSLHFINALTGEWLIRQSEAAQSSIIELFQTISDLAITDQELLALYVYASPRVLGSECPADIRSELEKQICKMGG
jgi:hypothetical protein